MAFMSILTVFAAFIGIIISLFVFTGTCLLVIGVTGIALNKMDEKYMQAKYGAAKRIYSINSIILGVIFLLFPIGYVLYGIISSLYK